MIDDTTATLVKEKTQGLKKWKYVTVPLDGARVPIPITEWIANSVQEAGYEFGLYTVTISYVADTPPPKISLLHKKGGKDAQTCKNTSSNDRANNISADTSN